MTPAAGVVMVLVALFPLAVCFFFFGVWWIGNQFNWWD